MAQFMRPLLCRHLQSGSAQVPKHATSYISHLRPVCFGPVVINERNYRARKEREALGRYAAILNADFMNNDKLFNRVTRCLATVTSQGDLVYKGRIGHLFRMLKMFSLTTSSIGLAVQPYLLITYADMSLAAALPMFGAINMFVFLNPILIHFVAKKYVSELYFNPQSGVFTAVLLTFFARRMHFTFKASDVEVPDVPSPFAMLTARGKPLFVHEADFQDLEVYKHMMGFDRPLNIVYNHEKEEKEN